MPNLRWQTHWAPGGKHHHRNLHLDIDDKMAVQKYALIHHETGGPKLGEAAVHFNYIAQSSRGPEVQRRTPNGKGQPLLILQLSLIDPQQPHDLRTPPLGVAQVIGVINDSLGVRVLVVDTNRQHMLVPLQAPRSRRHPALPSSSGSTPSRSSCSISARGASSPMCA